MGEVETGLIIGGLGQIDTKTNWLNKKQLPWLVIEQTDWAVGQHLLAYSSSLQFEAAHVDEPITFLSWSEPALYVFHLYEPYNPVFNWRRNHKWKQIV